MQEASALLRLRALVSQLRLKCPWDRAQSLGSMRPYLLEETYEVLAALDAWAAGSATALPQLREELGDLLFQVYFLAELAGEPAAAAGANISIEIIAAEVHQKMVTRHPHVFGGALGAEDGAAGGSIEAWETQKARTRKGSRVDGVPASLPALLRAHRVGEKVAHVGFDWPDVEGVLAKVDEERAELTEAIASGDREAILHEYGDLLLASASLGRALGICGEDALRVANQRFETRFREVERQAAAAGVPLEEAGPERLESWWQVAKRCEQQE